MLRLMLLDTKLLQLAGNIVAIDDAVFLSEIWQELAMGFL